jgi:hypothetical protein
MRLPSALLACCLVSSLAACSASKTAWEDPLVPVDSGTSDSSHADTLPGADTAPEDTAGLSIDSALDTTPPPGPAEVWAQSADTLYKLDPTTKVVTVIGKFSGCSSVVDIALDEKSNLYASAGGIYSVDKKTAACTPIGGGSFAGNSLSFVPAGTIDPSKEVMVTYSGDQYMRVDQKTGVTTTIGSVGGGYGSSGDIVSVKGGGTYLSAYGPDCTPYNCLLQVDPKTGALKKNWGQITGGSAVYGLAYWAGNIYGFDSSGKILEVTFTATGITTKEIPFTGSSGISFWGAGSTTSAPVGPVK